MSVCKFIFLCCVALTGYVHAEDEPWAPDFIIVGAQKSGTTELFRYIKDHPLVVNKRGEIHFFDLQFSKGLGWYKQQFPKRPSPEYKIGDKSPYYLFHPLVPKRVAKMFPNVKILMILRNPTDRAYSQYWHNVRRKREKISFEGVVKAEPQRLEGELEKILKNPKYNSFHYQHSSYLARGIYVDQVKRWLSYFPKEQIMILSSKDLRNDPNGTMARVFEFLGLPVFQDWKQHPDFYNVYPPMDPNTRKELSDYFRPYNQQLEELLNMKFNWD